MSGFRTLTILSTPVTELVGSRRPKECPRKASEEFMAVKKPAAKKKAAKKFKGVRRER
jgi:hypothetical protein